MSNAKDLSMTPGAIRARKRRDEERDNNRYNQTLKEYITYKYSNIINEFDPFYRQLQTKYPRRRFYSNTNEFRRWRREMIVESFKEVGVEAVVFDQQDLHGDDEQEQQQHGEQEQQHDEQEQQQHGDDEQQQHGEQEQQQHGDDEQQQHGDDEQQQHGEQNEQHGEQEQSDQHDDEGNIDNEVIEIIAELENNGVLLHDEGIHLDVYEELQADIEDFDYRLEVELDQW